MALLIRRNVQETKILADVIIGKLCVPDEYQYIHAEQNGIIIPSIKIYYPPYNTTSDKQFEESAYDISSLKSSLFTWHMIVFVKDTKLAWQKESKKPK